jgi:uncharacterized protein YdcH (DUF465 family)
MQKITMRGSAMVSAAKNTISKKEEEPEAEGASGPPPPDHSPPPSPTPEEDEDHHHSPPEPEHPPQDEPPPHPEDEPPPDEPLVDGEGMTIRLRFGEPSGLASEKYLGGKLYALVYFNHGEQNAPLELVKRLDLHVQSDENEALLQLHEGVVLTKKTVAMVELYKDLHLLEVQKDVFLGKGEISGLILEQAKGQGAQDLGLSLVEKDGHGVAFNAHVQGTLNLEVDVRKWSNWTSVPCVCCLEILAVKGLADWSHFGSADGHYAIVAVNSDGASLDSVGKKENTEGYKNVFALDWSGEREAVGTAAEETVLKVQLWGKDEIRMNHTFLGEVRMSGAELQELYKAKPDVTSKRMTKPLGIDLEEADIDSQRHVDGEVSIRVRIKQKSASSEDDTFEEIEEEEEEVEQESEAAAKDAEGGKEDVSPKKKLNTSLPSLAVQDSGEIAGVDGPAKTPNANGSSKLPSYSPNDEKERPAVGGATLNGAPPALSKNGIAAKMAGSPAKAGSPANDIFAGQAAEAILKAKAASYTRELREIYRTHDPENEHELDRLLVQYGDHLDKLLDGVRTKYGVPDPYKKQEDQIKKQDEEIENLKKERLELKDQMDALLQSTASKKACWFC